MLFHQSTLPAFKKNTEKKQNNAQKRASAQNDKLATTNTDRSQCVFTRAK
jgi:hypothetical protein